MEKKFWLEKWDIKQIGFHKDTFNHNLLDHYNKLNLSSGNHIFVPLCGKTLDMLWLANQGLKVSGIELSPVAIKEFFSENNLEYTIEKVGPFNKYISNNISIYEGDIFELTTEILGQIDGIYDRASTVALPEQIRANFLNKLKEFMPNLNILMVLLEYDQSLIDGPPFSVPNEFVKKNLLNCKIEVLKDNETLKVSPKFKEVNAVVKEKVLFITNS